MIDPLAIHLATIVLIRSVVPRLDFHLDQIAALGQIKDRQALREFVRLRLDRHLSIQFLHMIWCGGTRSDCFVERLIPVGLNEKRQETMPCLGGTKFQNPLWQTEASEWGDHKSAIGGIEQDVLFVGPNQFIIDGPVIFRSTAVGVCVADRVFPVRGCSSPLLMHMSFRANPIDEIDFDDIRVYSLGVPERVPATAIGDAFAQRREYLLAADEYHRVAANLPGTAVAAEAAYKQGLCLYRLGEYDRAFAAWKPLVELPYAGWVGLHRVECDLWPSELVR